MGYRQRAACLDLLAEQRDNRTGRAQHIAEANHGEAGLVDTRHPCVVTEENRCQLQTERLQDQFSQSLGTSHDIGGAHGLVGRNEYEVTHPRLQGSLCGVQGADDIVQQPFGNIVLDHGYMLVGSRVINRVNAPSCHDRQYLLLIADRPQNWQHAYSQRGSFDFLFQLAQNTV
ncbi:hypothetical protein D3C80_1532550 [compost metagenome]